MEFKKLKIDGLALMADLVSREANERTPALAAALRRIEIIEKGRYGEGRPDVRVTIALAPGIEAAVENNWGGDEASLSMLVEDVGELIDAAERVYDDRHCTIDMLKEVRGALSREVAKARRRGLPYRTTDVSLTPSDGGYRDLPAVRIGLEVIGPLLQIERIAFDAESAEEVIEGFQQMRDKQEERLALRDHLVRIGADVMIDSVTLEAIKDAGIAPADAISELRRSDVGIVDIDLRHGRMVLYVRNGVVTGNVPLGEGMRWQEGRVTVPKARGLSVARIKGKALNRVLPHDYFDERLEVFSASDFHDSVWVNVLAQHVALSLGELKQAA